MNIMKKIVSTMSALAVVAGMACVPASAVSTSNYNVSYDTLTQAISTDDGSMIPAGSIAVTVSVTGNRGFNANTFVLDVGDENSVILNESGHPAVTKSQAFSSALVASDFADSTVCVAVAMSNAFCANGDLFTIYLDGSNTVNEETEIISTDEQRVTTDAKETTEHNNNTRSFTEYDSVQNQWWLMYYSGDANDDNVVNASDATKILVKLNSAGVPYFVVDIYNYSYYFPVMFRAQPDADKNGVINSTDASEILQYAASVGTGGGSYTGNAGTKCYGRPL